MTRYLIIVFLLLNSLILRSQDKERFKFAQTYIGVNWSVLTGNGALTTSQRTTFGGLHFWGKADFYVSFPIANQNLRDGFDFSEGVMTGGRWIPFGLKNNGLRPFIGMHWQTPSLYGHEIPKLQKHAFVPEIGFYYLFKKRYTIEFGLRYNAMNKWKIPNSNDVFKTAQFGLDISLKKYFDFTASTSTENARLIEQEVVNNNDQNSIGFGVGISSTMALQSITDLDDRGFELTTALIDIMPELGLSYYSAKKEIVLRLAYRPTNRLVKNKEFSYLLQDKRLSVEVFKFLFDYQGFVPFVGIGFTNSFYNLMINTNNGSNVKKSGANQSLGFVFGWDIRPTQAEWFILRTSLRYQPKKGYNAFAQHFFSRDLEFNFIQMVVYPNRIKYHF